MFQEPCRASFWRLGQARTPAFQNEPELPARGLQLSDLRIQVLEFQPRTFEHHATRNSATITNSQNSGEFMKRKTDGEGSADQANPVERIRAIIAIPVGPAQRRFQQAEMFVMPNGVRRDSRAPRQFAGSHSFGVYTLEPIPGSSPICVARVLSTLDLDCASPRFRACRRRSALKSGGDVVTVTWEQL